MRVLVYDRNDSPLFEITPDELYGLVRDEQLDGPRSLTITTTHVLQKNMRVLVRDATERWHEYVVEGCDEEHGKGNRPIGTYWCSWSMQHDLELTVVSKMPSGGVSTALAAVLSGTKRWTAGTVTKIKTASASMYEMGGWEAVAVMCDAGECEVDDEITVDTAGVVSRSMAALEHVGSSTATRRFDYGTDMKSIKRSVDEEPVFARVIPKGMGEETDTGYYGRRIGIESVNGGVPWIENATTAPYLRVPDGEGGYEYPTRYVVNDELDDPAELKAWALANLDEWTAPKVTYGADLCQFQQAGLDANGVALGDEVQVVDRAFGEDGLRIAARVVSLRINELDPADMALVIGDAPANMATGLTTLAGTLSDVKSTVEVMNGGSMTTADYLSRLVDRLNYAINATGGYSYLVPGLGMVTYDVPVADPADPVEASAVVEIRGGTVRIADSKNQDGTWQYKTVFTSGHLAADVVTAANITAGYIGSSSGTFIDLDNGIAQFGDTSGIWTQVAQTAFNVRQGATDVLATFGASGAQIGKSNSTHTIIDSDSLDVVDGNGDVLATFGANYAQVGSTDDFYTVIDSNGFTMNQGSRTGLFNIYSIYEVDGSGNEGRELEVFLDPYQHSYIKSWTIPRVDPQHLYNTLTIHNQKGNIEIRDIDENDRYSIVALENGVRLSAYDSSMQNDVNVIVNLDGFAITRNYTTMLGIDSSSNVTANGNIFTSMSDVDTSLANNGVSSNCYRNFGIRDKNNRYTLFCQTGAMADGSVRAEFAARNYGTGANATNLIRLIVDNAGGRSVELSAPAAWRSALELNTWTTVAIGDFATAASGWSFASGCNIQYNAALGALRVRIQVTTSGAQTAGQKTLFTVKTAYRPLTFAASLSSLTTYAQAGQIYTTGGFAVNISAISASTSLYFNGVYFIGA